MAFQPASERRATFPRQAWFAIEELAPGVFAITEPFHTEHVRSHLILGDDRALLIDTGMGVGDLRAVVDELTSLPVTVVNSHTHWDHIGSNWQFDDIAVHAAEVDRLPLGMPNEQVRRAFTPEALSGPLPPRFDPETAAIRPSRPTTILSDGETYDLGGRKLEVIHAPGHSPGGIVLLDRANGFLFSTDVAYAGPLYAFGEDADFPAYRQTLGLLAELAPLLNAVFPSHNAARIPPATSMRDAVESIAAGRPPDAKRDSVDRHQFDGFSVLVDAGAGGR
jgi:glyoxylase-like metal-dependent hydrolase (beta-lactamase superfamily II)